MLVIADNGADSRGARLGSRHGASRRPAIGEREWFDEICRTLEEIGGCCSWDTAPGEGTRAKLVVVVKPGLEASSKQMTVMPRRTVL